MRVLIFDDEDAIGRLIVKTATMAGFDATSVTDAASFAARLRTDSPNVVLLDLQLGETDGVAQLRMLADRKFPGSIVLMSGFDARVLATARGIGHSLGLKVVGVLEKPLRLAQLEQVLDRLMQATTPLTLDRLRCAIANDEMCLEFQPIVSRTPKKLQKLEALIRWDHPTLGRIPPGDFVPLAESDVATIDALTDWVLGAATESYQVLAELGITVPLSINMSAQNLRDLTLPDRVEKRLRAGNMPARHLQIEITESAAFADATRTMEILSRLRLKGVALSMDDFGTGYSSLKLLQQMPFSEIKIDRSFVTDLTTSKDSRAITKSIIDLATNMELTCVAEGVETEQVAAQLEQLGARNLQGYLVARPMPVESVATWLAFWDRSALPPLLKQAASAAYEPTAVSADALNLPVPSGHLIVERRSEGLRLPPRQLQVMQLLSEGLAVKEIARNLSLGTGTVKVHLSLAYSALGARNRIEAIIRAGPLLRPPGAPLGAAA
jgi:EAL domain-containing protein (putative c-di-GMP-specific phosphodiesterase class I)/DNA-binding NarL/FixJ family response regulator